MATIDRVSSPIFGILLKPALFQIARKIHAVDADITALDLFEVLHRVLRRGDAYAEKHIPKKHGGWRLIQKPYDKLKTVQRCMLHGLLKYYYQATPVCHSFIGGRFEMTRSGVEVWRPGRSIVSNAWQHLGVRPKDAQKAPCWRKPISLFGVDLKDAYPSVSSERAFEIYHQIMGDPWTSQIMTWLSVYEGCLPQGAPTSPILFNLSCRGLDAALWESFSETPFCVTRYADDITLTSLEKEVPASVKERLVRICNQYGFSVNRAKDFYARDRQRVLRVTGVNIFPGEKRLGLPQPVMARFRAIIFYCLRTLDGLVKEKGFDFSSAEREICQIVGKIRGVAGFTRMVYGYLPKRIFDWNPGGWHRTKKILLRPEIQRALKSPAAKQSQTPKPESSETEKAFFADDDDFDFRPQREPEQLWLSPEIFDQYFRDAIDVATDYSIIS